MFVCKSMKLVSKWQTSFEIDFLLHRVALYKHL